MIRSLQAPDEAFDHEAPVEQVCLGPTGHPNAALASDPSALSTGGSEQTADNRDPDQGNVESEDDQRNPKEYQPDEREADRVDRAVTRKNREEQAERESSGQHRNTRESKGDPGPEAAAGDRLIR